VALPAAKKYMSTLPTNFPETLQRENELLLTTSNVGLGTIQKTDHRQNKSPEQGKIRYRETSKDGLVKTSKLLAFVIPALDYTLQGQASAGIQ
jgi:hypothetical protein